MILHNKYEEVTALTKAGIPVLLTGEKGSGKTTLAKQVAENINLKFFSMSMTRQTTLSHLMGFVSVNGTYIPSQLYEAASNGGLYLLDELDGSDPNVLLSLNTIENGFISFPTGIVEVHKDFRLMATANPQNQHEFYVGRSKLDAATLDRFDIIEIETDKNLERSLISFDIYQKITVMRSIVEEFNSSKHISMRDSMRYQVRKDLGLDEGFEKRILSSDAMFSRFKEKSKNMPSKEDQKDCETFEELYKLALAQTEVYGNNEEKQNVF